MIDTRPVFTSCDACGDLVAFPSTQHSGSVRCGCGATVDVAHAWQNVGWDYPEQGSDPECLCVETYGAAGTYTDECPTHSGH